MLFRFPVSVGDGSRRYTVKPHTVKTYLIKDLSLIKDIGKLDTSAVQYINITVINTGRYYLIVTKTIIVVCLFVCLCICSFVHFFLK